MIFMVQPSVILTVRILRMNAFFEGLFPLPKTSRTFAIWTNKRQLLGSLLATSKGYLWARGGKSGFAVMLTHSRSLELLASAKFRHSFDRAPPPAFSPTNNFDA